MLFIKYFTYSKKKDWFDGCFWLVWHLIFSLLPIWITIIGLCGFNQKIKIEVFTGNAEFALYSTSFLATCLYIVLREFRKGGFPSRGILSIICFPVLFFSGIMYSIVAILNVLDGIGIPEPLKIFNKDLLIKTSLWLLPAVLLLTFLVIVVDNIQSTTDIRLLQNESLGELENEFDAIQEG